MKQLTPQDVMTQARYRALRDEPWFGAPGMALKATYKADDPSAATDGTVLIYGDTFTAQPAAIRLATVLHEYMHCGFRDPWRRGERDADDWNLATDYRINGFLRDRGHELWEGALYDERFRDPKDATGWMSGERIYSIIHTERLNQQAQDQSSSSDDASDESSTADDAASQSPQTSEDDGDDQPSDDEADDSQSESSSDSDGESDEAGSDGTGKGAPAPFNPRMYDAPTEEQAAAAGDPPPLDETFWQLAFEEAMGAARKAGLVPAGLEAHVRADDFEVAWQDYFRNFMARVVPTDYTWSRPNRRFAASGPYLPSIKKDGVPRIVVAVDASGSMWGAPLEQVMPELKGIHDEAHPEQLEVVYFDATVGRIDTYGPWDDVAIEQIAIPGGGGTVFQPVLDYLAESEPPDALVILSDLWLSDTATIADPECPTLWVVPSNSTETGPWGETIRLSPAA